MHVQSCPTFCNPMDWSPPGSSVHGISQARNTRTSCHFLLQGIFLTQTLNPCLQGLLVCLKQITLDTIHGTGGKEPTCQCRRQKRCRFDPCVGKIPWSEGMATHSSTLAWRIPMDRGAWHATVLGSQRVVHDWSDLAHMSYPHLILTTLTGECNYVHITGEVKSKERLPLKLPPLVRGQNGIQIHAVCLAPKPSLTPSCPASQTLTNSPRCFVFFYKYHFFLMGKYYTIFITYYYPIQQCILGIATSVHKWYFLSS